MSLPAIDSIMKNAHNKKELIKLYRPRVRVAKPLSAPVAETVAKEACSTTFIRRSDLNSHVAYCRGREHVPSPAAKRGYSRTTLTVCSSTSSASPSPPPLTPRQASHPIVNTNVFELFIYQMDRNLFHRLDNQEIYVEQEC
ncbi:hypothetical protein LSAT2_019168 [Lamellibrachia satsuma]|nr:hypothetical protein LSAT2_019168 [Lamellibrachia satsuma]